MSSSCNLPHFRLNNQIGTIEQACNVEPDYSHQLFNLFVLLAFKAKFFSEGLSKALISNSDGLLNFLFDDVLVEELWKGLGNFAFHEFGDALECVCSALELVEVFEGKAEWCELYTLRSPSTSLMYFWRFYTFSSFLGLSQRKSA